MDLIKEIFANEVFPALGCTEPISCAYTCAAASEQLQAPVEKLKLIVDPGTYKNVAAVTIPNSGGQKGNVIAAAMGAVIAHSDLRLEILRTVTPEVLEKARKLIDSGA
jgi:L-cysteine desulfidase